jgi:iron complex outermembrane receptor protein
VTLDNQLQANFDTGPLSHTALLGLDYRWDDSEFERGIGAAPPLDVFDPNYGADISKPDVTTHTGQKQDQVGVYLQDQIALDHWRLTLSGRHDWVDTTTENFIANTDQQQSSSAFSGRAGLNYVFDFGLSPYVSYARSFQPAVGTSFDGAAFKPTTGTQYEAGIKYQPTGTNLALDAAVFTLTQQNVLTADAAAGHNGFSVQTGEVRSRGVELDATASLAEGLNLVAAYTYTDADVTQSNGVDDGKRVITVPKHQASLWLDYTISAGDFAGLGFGGGVRYFGGTYGDAANTLHIPDYTLVDAMLRYDLGEISTKLKGAKFTVNANNLFNKKYVSTCTGLTACYYGAERLVTANLSYSW